MENGDSQTQDNSNNGTLTGDRQNQNELNNKAPNVRNWKKINQFNT